MVDWSSEIDDKERVRIILDETIDLLKMEVLIKINDAFKKIKEALAK